MLTELHSNLVLVHVVYGLAFFSMGLAILLQWRRESLLPLGHALPVLIVFAFLHSLVDWLVMTALLRTGGLGFGNSAVEALRLGLLAASYLLLLWFGTDLLAGRNTRRWLPDGVTLLFLFVWAGTVLVYLTRVQPTAADWSPVVEDLTRYLLGAPGGLLAAFGWLRERKVFRRLGTPAIGADCSRAAAMFALFALATGLGPRTLIFPATFLNYDSFLATVGLPVELFRAILAVSIAYFIVRIMRAYGLELRHRLDRADRESFQAQQLAAVQERERIGREIHDGLAQTLGCLALRISAAQGHLAAHQVERTQDDLGEIADLVNQAYADAREAILALSVSSLSGAGSGLTQTVSEYVSRFGEQSNIMSRLNVDEKWSDTLPADVEIQVIRIIQEALSNVRKHALARSATVELRVVDGCAEIAVLDDGRGFDPQKFREGDGHHFGMQMMRERARLIGGSLTVKSVPERGTRLVLRLPCEKSGRGIGRVSEVATGLDGLTAQGRTA